MGSYRPPQYGYGPPPGQDQYARPGSTTYGQPQQPAAGAQGYGSPIAAAPTWNGQQYGTQYSSSQPLPPPPATAPPTNPAPYGYQIQTVGGQTVAPVLPPRIPQPYNQSTSTPPAQPYQPPTAASGHQRVPSIPDAYNQNIQQSSAEFPQHMQYSNQPTTHRYDPPLPPRPGTQPPPNEGGRPYSTYGQPPAPQEQPGVSQYQYTPAPGAYQHPAQGQSYEPSPQSGSVYSQDDAHHNPYQTPGGYVPPPPPPKPQQYGQGPAYPGQHEQPARPASISHSYGQPFQAPPQGTAYPGQPQAPSAAIHGHDLTSQYQSYDKPLPPGPNQHRSHPQPSHAQVAGQYVDSQYGRQTPQQPISRPASRPQQAYSHGRPSISNDDQPVSPLQGRQSISFERPGSTANAGPGAAPGPPKSAFALTSDWEHFGSGADEIDDTAMYGVKKDDSDAKNATASVELPASSPLHARTNSDISAPDSFRPSPAVAPASQHHPTPPGQGYAPTPPTGYPTPQPPQHAQQAPPPEEADYIPPMPDTPPAARRDNRSSIVIGGSSSSHVPGPSNPGFVMDDGAHQSQQPAAYAMQQAIHNAATPAALQSRPQSRPMSSHEAVERVPSTSTFTNVQAEVRPSSTKFDPAAPVIDNAVLRKAQQQAEDYKAEIGHLQGQLMSIRSSITEKDSSIADRDSTISRKDAIITQKDSEIAHKDSEIAKGTARSNELQASLAEMEQTFQALKASEADQVAKLQNSETAQAELKTKLEQVEASKIDLSSRLEQSARALTAGLATAAAKHENDKRELESKHVADKAELETKHADSKKEVEDKLQQVQKRIDTLATETEELKKQLEDEKAKAVAKASEPVNIAPGLEAWFKGSLERCKEMLYTESKPIPVQEKLQVFMDFVNAEARLRGIDMPFGPKGEVKGFNATASTAPVKEAAKPERPKVTPPKESDGFVMVNSDEDVQYSPGGRPILKTAPSEEYSPGGRPIMNHTRTLPIQGSAPPRPEKAPTLPNLDAVTQASAYRPFRAGDAASNPPSKGPSPALAGPSMPPQPVYKPFSWQQGGSGSGTPNAQTPVSTPPAQPVYKPLYKPAPSTGNVPKVDTALKHMPSADVLFDPVPGGPRPKDRRDTLKSPQDETMLPMPLKPRTPAPPTVSTASTATLAELPAAKSPSIETSSHVPQASKPSLSRNQSLTAIEDLSQLLTGDTEGQPSKRLLELSEALDVVSGDYTFTKTITKSWEDKAAITRSRLAKERAQRQADMEKRNTELFDNGEIGYGDLDELESEAKEDELRSKAQEEADEYEDYSKEVFDAVYTRCHEAIGELVKLQGDVEALLRGSSAGQSVIDGGDSISQTMQLLLKVHDKIELAHSEVTKAIQERDRKYKLTQTKPLYAAGDIAAMKRVEKQCEEAEKKADVRARVERAERCKRLHRIVETEMERGAGENEDYSADIVNAAEDTIAALNENEKARVLEMLAKAGKVIAVVYEDTQSLMRSFSQIDAQLNDCEYEVSLASARLKGDPKEYFERLENEKKREDGKLKDDEVKRSNAVKEHQKEAEGQLKMFLERASEGSEEREARGRKERALEEARRRNGEI